MTQKPQPAEAAQRKHDFDFALDAFNSGKWTIGEARSYIDQVASDAAADARRELATKCPATGNYHARFSSMADTRPTENDYCVSCHTLMKFVGDGDKRMAAADAATPEPCDFTEGDWICKRPVGHKPPHVPFKLATPQGGESDDLQ